MAYSIGPWLGVLPAGYLVGPWLQLPLPQRTRYLRWTGAGLLLLFGALRATNWYGEPSPWGSQARGTLYSVLFFVNVTKYPPSLLFDCLTLGVTLLLLSGAENAPDYRWDRWLRTYGQVPFFYYLLHLALLSGGAWWWTHMAFGQSVNFSFSDPKQWPPAYAPSLLRAYAVWLAVVLLLYWPCRWYQRYKQHTHWWLLYL
ncbi:MAG: hypothetical protein ACRYFX_30410 [Janthinobacterium lividum]